MRPEKIAQKNAARAKAAGGASAVSVAADAVSADDAVADKADLANPEVQAKIQDPTPATLTIGGDEVMLYPLPAKQARKLVGLVAKIIVETGKRNDFLVIPAALRVGSTISEDDDLSAQVSAYVARSEYEPHSDVDSETLAERAADIDERADYNEFAKIFDKVCELNKIIDVFKRPKSPAGSATSTTI